MELKILNNEKPLKNTKVIAIGSGKGGVGKSSITVCLAYVLKSLGIKVGVLDADIYGPSLRVMLPHQKPPIEKDGWLYPAHSSNIEVMSISYFNKNKLNTAIRAPIVNAMIKRFTQSVKWSDLDILLIDLPPGTGDIHLTLMQSIPLDGAVVVTTPQNVSVSDVKKSVELFQKMQVPILGVIENMSYYLDPFSFEKHFIFGSGGGIQLAKEFQIPLLGQVPLDEELCNRLDNGKSIFEGKGAKVAKQVLTEIGIEILDKICDHTCVKKTFFELNKQDDLHFSIKLDGVEINASYADLQKQCPCARCVDEVSGIRVIEEEALDPRVEVKEIEKIGNYGLRLHFNSGCQQGIYTWDILKNL